MSRYIIGIDGGASRSTAILVDADGRQIRSESNQGLNPLSLSQDEFKTRIAALIQNLTENIETGDVSGLCAGLAGTGNETVRLQTESTIRATTGITSVHVISDALAALWGAFQGKAGLLLIAGTGSICLGLDDAGNTARSGGFGRILGDEGSGYWLSIQAIRQALKEVDTRSESSNLPPLIIHHFILKDLREIIPQIQSGDLAPDKIATLAAELMPLSQSDGAAKKIVEEGASHLAELIESTARKLELSKLQVALWGGLWQSPGQEMQKALQRALSASKLVTELVEPAEPPEWGAVRYFQNLIS